VSSGGVVGTGGTPTSGGLPATGGNLSGGASTIAGSATGGLTSTSTGSATKANITRWNPPQSGFTPVDLEAVINDLVAELNKAAPADLRVNVILKQVSTYFQPIVTGAQRAMAELQISGNSQAPEVNDSAAAIQAQISMMTDDIAQGAKGIGIAPFRDDLLTPINDAVAAGVPVVTVDSDLAASNRDLYIGTLNPQAGMTAGNTLKRYLPPGGGTVAILGQDESNWPDGYNRTMGAKAVLDAAGYTTTVLTANWTDSGATDIAALQNILANANPPAVGMIGMFSNAWECGKAAEKMGLTGADIAIVAFDFDPVTIQYMQSGLIKATHSQRQYYMGYLIPYVLYGMNVLGKEKTKSILSPLMVDDHQLNTGLDVVPADQLDEYSAYLDSLGIGSYSY
jgi:ribose transport system substrate-binding protein